MPAAAAKDVVTSPRFTDVTGPVATCSFPYPADFQCAAAIMTNGLSNCSGKTS